MSEFEALENATAIHPSEIEPWAWFDFSDHSLITLHSDGRILEIIGRGDSIFDASNVSGNPRPTLVSDYKNGRAVADASTGYLRIRDKSDNPGDIRPGVATDGKATYFMVAERVAGDDTIILGTHTVSQGQISLRPFRWRANDIVESRFGVWGESDREWGTDERAGFFVATVIADSVAETVRVRINGEDLGPLRETPAFHTGAIDSIGSLSSTTLTLGDAKIGEIAVKGGALTEDEILGVEKSLALGWGIISEPPPTEEEVFRATFADASGQPAYTTALVSAADCQRLINHNVSLWAGKPGVWRGQPKWYRIPVESIEYGELHKAVAGKPIFIRADQPGLREGKRLLIMDTNNERSSVGPAELLCLGWEHDD